MEREDRGAEALDRLGPARLIPDDFDFEGYDESPERAKIIKPSSLADEVMDSFYGEVANSGEYLPWDKANDKGLRYRPREVTVYGGMSGNYKSIVTSQVGLNLMRLGAKCLFASFEMRPVQTLHRMVRQASGTDEPSTRYLNAFNKGWADDRMWIYDHLGECSEKKVLAVCRYVARELGVTHVFIDSLMKVVAGTDDYTAQKLFVGRLCAVALEHDIHIHLVVHARKGAKVSDKLDKFSIKGASEISDQVDNLVIIQRNKRKEEKIEAGEADLTDNADPDVFYSYEKQRNGAYEGTLGLYFNKTSLCLVEKPEGNWCGVNLDLGGHRE